MSDVRGVDHVNVDVDDLAACLQFYRDVLELSLVRGPDDFGGEHAMFTVGDTTVTLAETGSAAGWDERGIDHPLDKAHLAFEADRDEYERLMDRLDGQFPNQGPYDWSDFEGFYFLDPSGNLLEVITYETPADRDRSLLTHNDVVP